MEKSRWVWMPHAGHFILGDKCRFHLNTYVGKYIVSTIGELWNDEQVRRIHAEIHNPEWYSKNSQLRGDYFDSAYFKEFGFEALGLRHKYETMVFRARKSSHKCCPYEIVVEKNYEEEWYDTDEEAMAGHMKLCKKWSKIKLSNKLHEEINNN